MTQTAPGTRCRRCRVEDAVHTIRSDPLCNDCFCRFVATKAVKRLELLSRELRPPRSRVPAARRDGAPHSRTRTFCVGLSFGPSSAALVDVCEQIIRGQRAKNRDAAFTLHVVHVDTEPDTDGHTAAAEQRLDRWRARYPRFTFARVPLADVLRLDAIDWTALGLVPSGTVTAATTAAGLHARIAALPSATSRRDVLDLLVRRLLIARAAAAPTPYDALLLGCSTTALAERTLAETAKGRGFALPWLINDGPVDAAVAHPHSVPLYYPLRELFRNELVLYIRVMQPPLADDHLVVLPPPPSAAAVVAHKDLSIEDAMTRYFSEVEVNYPSIVANVVRTTSKLERQGAHHSHSHAGKPAADAHAPCPTGCRLCGMPLDEAGNERWQGEIGRLDGAEGGPRPRPEQLCYGCDRSLHG